MKNKFIMKNLKKLSRKELKNLKGLGSIDEAFSDDVAGGGSTYRCCTTLYDCDSTCSTSSNCPSGKFLQAC